MNCINYKIFDIVAIVNFAFLNQRLFNLIFQFLYSMFLQYIINKEQIIKFIVI